MSIHVALNHVTHYRYDRPVTLGPQVVRLRPAPHSRTRILSYSHARRSRPSTSSTGSRTRRRNYLARLVFPDKTTRVRASRWTWWPRWRSSTRSTSSSSRRAEQVPVRLRRRLSCASSRRTCVKRARRRPLRRRTWRHRARQPTPHDRLPGRAQPAPAARTSAT